MLTMLTNPTHEFPNKLVKFCVCTNANGVLKQDTFILPFEGITYLGLTKSIVVCCEVLPALISYRKGLKKIPILNTKKSMEDFRRYLEADGQALEDISLDVQVLEEQENEIVPNIIPTLSRDLKLKIKMQDKGAEEQTCISPENSDEAMIKKELIVNEITKVFTREVDASLKHTLENKLSLFIQNAFKEKTSTEETTAKNIPQKREEGVLRIVRLNKSNLVDLLKSGSGIVIPMDNNDILLLNFVKDSNPVMNGIKLNWLKNERPTYSCNEAHIPVSIGNDINYISDRDAEFIKNFDGLVNLAEKTEPDSKRKQSVKKSKEHKLETKMVKLSVPMEQSKMTSETLNSNDVPTSLVHYLESFKSGLLSDIRNTVTNLVGTSAAQPNPEAVNGAIAATTAEYENLNLIENLKEMRLMDDENGPSTSKHRARDGCSKKMCPSKRREYGKLVEVSSNLFIFSKAGFKIRMPRNSSKTVRFHLMKYGKFRGLKDEPVLEVHTASDGIECCVKPVSSTENKISTIDKSSYSFYDIRIKTKDKSGKFRLYFNVIHHNKNCGRSVKVDIRVRKGYVLDGTDTVYVGTENQTLNKPNTATGDFSTKAARLKQALEKFDDNQEEYFYSPSSDSEDSDAEDSKPELLKDEGIDTCFHSASFNEKSFLMPKNDSDDDAYSTISFLHDEDEARENTEIIRMPSLFFPEQFQQSELLESDFVPVRIKYKTMKNQESDFVPVRIKYIPMEKKGNNSASSGCSVSDEAVTNGDEMFVSSVSQTAPNREPENTDFLEGTANQVHNRSAYPNMKGLKEAIIPNEKRPVYPNMRGFKEVVNPITERPVYPNMKGLKEDMTANANMADSSKTAEPSTSGYQAGSGGAHDLFKNLFDQGKIAFERNGSQCEKGTSDSLSSAQNNEHVRKSDPTSPINILPEKVFETAGDVFKSVFSTFKTQAEQGVGNIRQHAENTITVSQDVINSISNEIGNIASVVADSSKLISQQPIPAQAPSASHAFDAVYSENTISPSRVHGMSSENATSTRVNSSSTSTAPSQTEERLGLPPSFNEERQLLRKCMEHIIKAEYKDYSPMLVNNLLMLNDMGFFNHQHNFVLLKQNKNNLSKVIEILIRS